MKQKYSITIAGSSLTIISEENEEYIAKLSNMLDKRVNDLMINKYKCTKYEALILTALDYLDSAIKLKAEIAGLNEQINELKIRKEQINGFQKK